MKDLDFDELDQAVSSVLGNDAAEDKKTSPPATVTPNVSPVAPSMPTPADPEPVEVTPPSTPAPAIVSPAARRRGQFLDMVHPSADMTNRSPVPPAARKRISPVSNDVSAPPTSHEVAEKSAAVAAVESEAVTPSVIPKSEPEIPVVSTPAVTSPTEESVPSDTAKKDVAWPDPLDLMSEKDDTKPVTPEQTPSETTDDVTTPAPSPTEDTLATPLTDTSSTPFVTDAKVDKRPLGAFGSTESETTSEEVTAPAGSTTDLDEQKVPSVTPPELQPDVVSVESADKEFGPEVDETESKPEPEPEQASEKSAKSGLSESIAQQYHTPPEVPEKAAHPIFDTHEYHQPLLPATNQKKKHGWLVILIILALLVVGSALGYFAFVAGF